MRTHGRLFLVFILSANIIASCRVAHDAAGSVAGSQHADEIPEIIFLNYTLYRDHGAYRAELTGRIIAGGRLKEPFPVSVPPAEGGLEILVQDHESRVLRRFFLTNPLNQNMEYVTGDGQLAIKEVQLDSAAFSLRFQLEPSARSVVLNRIAGAGVENEHLITTPLN